MEPSSNPLVWGDKRYHSLNYHLRQKYGTKVFKVALDAGFTCPNRDGTLSWQGCSFCSESGSGDFAGDRRDSLPQQFEQIKYVMAQKWNTSSLIAYFQAFSNTYAPVAELRQLYYQAIQQPGVVGLAIATRPDCLPPDVLALLEEISRHTDLWIELGLQTVHPKTARAMNLGYSYDDFLTAMHSLQARSIDTIAHIILGLPGESRADMIQTATKTAGLPLQGIKLHLLHLMQNTPLAQIYYQQPWDFLTREEYVDMVVDILELLPGEMVIHRLTGDSPRSLLIGPQWSLNKWEVLNRIERRLVERKTWQGKLNNDSIF